MDFCPLSGDMSDQGSFILVTGWASWEEMGKVLQGFFVMLKELVSAQISIRQRPVKRETSGLLSTLTTTALNRKREDSASKEVDWLAYIFPEKVKAALKAAFAIWMHPKNEICARISLPNRQAQLIRADSFV